MPAPLIPVVFGETAAVFLERKDGRDVLVLHCYPKMFLDGAGTIHNLQVSAGAVRVRVLEQGVEPYGTADLDPQYLDKVSATEANKTYLTEQIAKFAVICQSELGKTFDQLKREGNPFQGFLAELDQHAVDQGLVTEKNKKQLGR